MGNHRLVGRIRAPRATGLVLLLTIFLATAGCLSFLGSPGGNASPSGGGGSSASQGNGTGSGSGSGGSSGSGSGGSGSSGSSGSSQASSPGPWTPYSFVDGSTYRFDVETQGQGTGELTWSVDAVTASTVTITASLTLGGTTTTKQFQAPPGTIPSSLSITPLWNLLEGTLYDPVLQAVGSHDLIPGGSYSVQSPGGDLTVTVVGTRTLTTGTCSLVDVAKAGGTVLETCVAPGMGFPLDLVVLDPTTGGQLFHLTLASYQAP